MPKITLERVLLVGFTLIFCLTLLPSLVKSLLPAPRIVETVPANASVNVPIQTQQITFVFNQPMREKKNIIFRGMRTRGQPKWADDQRTILTLPLIEPLKPGAYYSIVLNSTSTDDELMKGYWGKPLDEYTLTFTTAPSDAMQSRIRNFNSGKLKDTDKDGLDDGLEVELKTLSTIPDTDGDGLTDYEEYCKYRTDPTLVDSDSDGIPDAEWSERREYTYSIRTVLELKLPWSLESMNDLFQDARLINSTQPGLQKVEVIIYPYASPVLYPTPYPNPSIRETFQDYISPTLDLNYSSQMQSEIHQILSGATNTLDVISKLLHEIGQMRLILPLYPPFAYTYKNQGKLVVDQEFFKTLDVEMTKEEITDILDTNYFGNSMFKRKQYGACVSRARLLASMLRAAGIPARISMAVPMIYYYKDTGEWERLIKNLGNESITGSFSCQKPLMVNEVAVVAHAQVEVYLNNHWIRIGYQLNEGPLFAATDKVFIKIIDSKDFTDVDFTKNWSPAQWIKERPYRTVELSDQKAKYK